MPTSVGALAATGFVREGRPVSRRPTRSRIPSTSGEARSEHAIRPAHCCSDRHSRARGLHGGVLDPEGTDRFAERQILFNATGIMLAIVIPTMLATLGVAFWFRASNERARYQPDFKYSGRIELLVWSIPLMTVLLVGTVAWIGAYDLDPPKPIASSANARQGSGRFAGLEMAVHLSRARCRERQSVDDSCRHAGELRSDIIGRHEQLLRATACRPDLHHGRNGDASEPAGRLFRNLPRHVGEFQRRRVCRHAFQCRRGSA